MSKKPCNEDCFNCVYDDCIIDNITLAKEPFVPVTPQQKKAKRFYDAHKEDILRKHRAYYAEHKEEINARRKQRTKEKKAAKAAAEAVNNNPILQ